VDIFLHRQIDFAICAFHIRQAVGEAVTTQTSMNVKAVDVFVDGIRFSD
jgi:uncharacterized alkaline shock family protein YloU